MFRKGQWVMYKGRVGIHLGPRVGGGAVGTVMGTAGAMETVAAPVDTCEVHLVDEDGLTDDVLFLGPESMEEVRSAYLEEIPDARRQTSDEGVLAARYASRAA